MTETSLQRLIDDPLQRAWRWLWVTLAVTLPLSVKLYVVPINLEIIFPAEPLIAALCLLAIILAWRERRNLAFTPGLWRHPVVLLAIGLWAVGVLFLPFSTMPFVSAKALAVRSAYMFLFFFIPVCGLPSLRVDVPRLFGLYAGAFALVLIYSLARQLPTGLIRNSGVHVAFPFYIDRTIYAAALVFVLIPASVMAWKTWRSRAGAWRAALWGLAVATLLLGCYATFCRAAWLSVVATAMAGALIMVGLRWKGSVISGLLGVVLLGVVGYRVLQKPTVTPVDSNADFTGWKEVVFSIPNITTDASNKERINRWVCAARMFRERPMAGFGAGTYQFQYIPYQRESWLTYLSWTESTDPGATLTSAWRMGDLMVKSPDQLYYYCGGSAHSEYFLALAEMGLPGFALFVALLLATFRTGLLRLDDPSLKARRWSLIAALLVLFAYSVHAVFNNFLDDCKVAFLFWSAIAWVVLTDLEARRVKGALQSQR